MKSSLRQIYERVHILERNSLFRMCPPLVLNSSLPSQQTSCPLKAQMQSLKMQIDPVRLDMLTHNCPSRYHPYTRMDTFSSVLALMTTCFVQADTLFLQWEMTSWYRLSSRRSRRHQLEGTCNIFLNKEIIFLKRVIACSVEKEILPFEYSYRMTF